MYLELDWQEIVRVTTSSSLVGRDAADVWCFASSESRRVQ